MPVPVPYPAFKILVSNTQIDLIFEKLISGRVVTVTHIGEMERGEYILALQFYIS